jgi:NitT/TauT family transport system permease protein
MQAAERTRGKVAPRFSSHSLTKGTGIRVIFDSLWRRPPRAAASGEANGLARSRPARALPVAFAASLVALWQFGASRQASPILPGPYAVVVGLAELVRNGLLFKYVVASLFRVTWGYLSAVVLGIPIGLFLGWHRRAGIAFNPLIQILRPISALAWIPLSILWFGVGDLSAIFLIFVASFLPLVVTSMNAVNSVDPVHLNAGRNFGLSPAQLVYRVIYPAAMPQMIVGLRIALGISWLVVVAAEMIAVNSGLGFLIIDARNAGNRYDLVVGAMLMIGLIGLVLDIAMRRLERLELVRWADGNK